MTCTSPITLGWPYNIKAPCGRCMACRIQRTREWATRIMHELNTNDGKAVFVTFTYNKENLPEGGSLVPDHVKAFLKRFRKAIEPRKIKYFLCGEYGDQFKRPHYHAILFNVDYNDNDLIKEKWPFGFVKIGTVTYESAAYVAGYIQKKINGPMQKEEYGDKVPPFQRQSRYIGYQWAEMNLEQLKSDQVVFVRGNPTRIPRYYRKKFDIDNEMVYSKIVEKLDKLRQRYADLEVDDFDLAKHIEKVNRQKAVTLEAKYNLNPRNGL